ncbi:hypothetical protein DV515_00001607 [Chloebia gouldiae]|uniref:Uncharacterized protein n=1 Tax=Chloebia gouldiae TaxID=44316 RepID=A0A3L8SZE0_CHLGU|nr:hypothetical protein DV515_00001607 [Chloebia gouldiae]
MGSASPHRGTLTELGSLESLHQEDQLPIIIIFIFSDYATVLTTLLNPRKLASSADETPNLRGRWVSAMKFVEESTAGWHKDD